MANVTQLYTILNAVASQAFGESAIAVVDTRSMVALGDAVMATDTDVDLFTGALFDRVGRTVVSVREWNDPENDPLVKKPFDFGTALQKIYVDLEDASPNNAWDIGKAGYVPSWCPVIKPSVESRVFNKISTWEFDFTIPDTLLRTAFINETEMSAFITAIYTAMENSLAHSVRDANNLTRATAIAYTLNHAGVNAINVLAEYNEAFPNATLTAAAALYSPDFLRFFTRRFLDTMGYMKGLSRAWNNEGFARHTPSEYMVATVLRAVDSAQRVYLQSDTFHNELVSLGSRYNTVDYWQGAGTSGYDVDDTSAIKISIVDPEDKTKKIDVERSGILAVLHDIEAMGTTINNRRMTTERNNKDEYTDTFSKANIGYFYDGSENIAVFYIADETP